MLEAQLVERDDAIAVGRSDNQEASLIDQLRQHLSPEEAQLFGIEEIHGISTSGILPLQTVLSGIGATAATTILFATIGFFATLGLSEPALSAIPAMV